MRLIFIVEGQTELEFIDHIIRPFFNTRFNFFDIDSLCIQTSVGHKGGFTKYSHLKNDILRTLKGDVLVTTFLDFFRIPSTLPDYELMIQEPDIDRKIELLQNGILNDIEQSAPNHYHRLIPYIQKHEFESLLFSDSCGFDELYDNEQITQHILQIIEAYPNPEDINDSPRTAPSKRIEQILANNGEQYSKVTEGCLIAEDIGLSTMLEKCPRFKNWICTLITRLGFEDAICTAS